MHYVSLFLGSASGVDDRIKNLLIACYLICSLLFILTLGGLSNQESAKKGNYYGVTAMFFAFVATMGDVTARLMNNAPGSNVTPWWVMWIVVALMIAPAAVIGVIAALRVQMTSMPELIALLHSFVGFAATVIGIAQHLAYHAGPVETWDMTVYIHKIETIVGIFIGGMTLVGSIVACGKLRELIRSKPLILGGNFRHVLNAAAVLIAIFACVMYLLPDVLVPYSWGGLMWVLIATASSLFIGWHMVMAIGGADMPVVISMLNSYSGWATSASGLMLDNMLMVVTGALVGSSGAILSYIMCNAMNRSFLSVIGGGFGEGAGAPAAPQAAPTGEMKPITTQETIDLFKTIKSLVIIPGYGMAAAQAQGEIYQLTKVLRARGVNVRFAIHPVAGRLPGHMNVLLADAKVPYDIVLEMDEINPDMPNTDVTLVVGANDIVNPDALDNPGSPIAGMPIIHAWEAKQCIVIKRGKGAGYAGIENPLFFKANTRMLYGSAKPIGAELVKGLSGAAGAAPAAPVQSEKTPLLKAEAPKPDVPETYPEPVKTIGIPMEVFPGECRVACTPDTAKELRKFGFAVVLQHGAGELSKFPDEMYTRVGCRIVDDPREIWNCDVVLKVRPPQRHATLGVHEAELLKPGHVLASFIYPARDPELIQLLQASRGTVLAMDCVPRITTAQKLDALSSMGGIMGYRAVVEAANFFPRYFTGQSTAAGKVAPAKVLIIGAGVAGLAAIGAAKGLGAIVRAFDVRAAVKEQIESMGGEFLTVTVQEDGAGEGGYAKKMSDRFLEAEHELFGAQAKEVDIIITTAQIPNQRAPVLITTPMVQAMRPGSVIVDLAAESGGNCELTQPGETIRTQNGVTIIGAIDLPSRMASQSSQLYSKNMVHLMDECGRGPKFDVAMSNPILTGCAIILNGELRWPACTKITQPAEAKKAAAPAAAAAPAPVAAPKTTAQAMAAPAAPASEGVGSNSAEMAARAEAEKECTWFGIPCLSAWSRTWSCLCVVTWCICPWWWCVKPCSQVHEKAPTCTFGSVMQGLVALLGAGLFALFAYYSAFALLDQLVIFTFAIIIGYMVIWNVTPALHTPLMSETNAVSGIIVCGGVFEIGTQLWGGAFFLGALAVFFASINIFGGFVVTQRMLNMFVLDDPKKGKEKKKGHH